MSFQIMKLEPFDDKNKDTCENQRTKIHECDYSNSCEENNLEEFNLSLRRRREDILEVYDFLQKVHFSFIVFR